MILFLVQPSYDDVVKIKVLLRWLDVLFVQVMDLNKAETIMGSVSKATKLRFCVQLLLEVWIYA